MERVQQGLVAAGAALFLVGMTITLGPATGLLGGSSVDAENATPTPGPDTQEPAAATPAGTPASGGPTSDDGGGPLVDADVDTNDDEENGGKEEDDKGEEGDGKGNGDKGNDDKSEERDRGNEKKGGHGDDGDESSDSLVVGVGNVIG